MIFLECVKLRSKLQFQKSIEDYLNLRHRATFFFSFSDNDYWGAFPSTREQRLGRVRYRRIMRIQRISEDGELLVRTMPFVFLIANCYIHVPSKVIRILCMKTTIIEQILDVSVGNNCKHKNGVQIPKLS